MAIYGLNIVGNLFPWGQILRGPAICSVKDTSENEQAVEREREHAINTAFVRGVGLNKRLLAHLQY